MLRRAQSPRRLFIGLMSGTSLDGIDAALVDFSAPLPHTLATHYVPFDPPLRAALLSLQSCGDDELQRSALAANQLARAYAAAVLALLAGAGVTAAEVEAIGAHGQTVRHRPEQGFTIQLNNPALLAELTGITVVADFRSRDIAAGGQGAPLVPAFHRAVFGNPFGNPSGTTVDTPAAGGTVAGGTVAGSTAAGSTAAGGTAAGSTVAGSTAASTLVLRGESDPAKTVATCSRIDRVIVNLGGIANITHLPALGAVAGFDTGPGNALMDLWVERHLGHAYDANGTWAASGRVVPALLERLLGAAYFSQPAPKSTGRDLFHADWLAQQLNGDEQPADVQATLCALTAHSVANAVNALGPVSSAPEAYVCGGGAHNAQLLRLLREFAPRYKWQLTDALGVPADWVEAVAFGWLAYQLIERQPANLVQVTGAAGPRLLGAIFPA